MILHLISTELDNPYEMDLSTMLSDVCCVTGPGLLFTRMLGRVCEWVTSNGVEVSGVYCDKLDADDEIDFGLGMSSGVDFFERLREVALLVWYLEHKDRWVETARVFAVIQNVGLKYFNFENIESQVEDDYHGEYPDDIAEWAEEQASDLGYDVPDCLASHINWESFGEDLLEDYSVVEWGNLKFLYSS